MSTVTATQGFDLGGGGNSFQFDKVGDSVTGKILTIEQVQQTDLDTGKPATWDNGSPKTMIRIELETDLREDEADDGHRSVYLKGARKAESKSSMAAVLGAVRAATKTTLIVEGSTLTLTYSGDGTATKRGWNAPKEYEAEYKPATVSLDIDEAPKSKPKF